MMFSNTTGTELHFMSKQMLNLKKPYSFSLFPPAANWKGGKKRYVFWFCGFVLLLAFLELGQDYISSVLNDSNFFLIQSLVYKLFWLLFIPFSILLMYWWEKMGSISSTPLFMMYGIFAITLITLMHLVIFSLLLFGISGMVYEEPWSLYYLLTEKLSTRLYIGFAIYIVFSFIYYRVKQKEAQHSASKKKYSKHIPVKNGRQTTLVTVDKIGWINSDGSYLAIHTPDKKHVIIGSLKNIITRLPDSFKRIHRSTIVNTNHIKKLKSRGNGDYDVIMDAGETLRLSRNYTKPLRGLLI